MKDIIPAKKQSPILGLTGMGGGVGGNLGGSLAEKTYIEDVFSTYLYKGGSSAKSINNGIDLSGKGGLVWTKVRNQSWWGPLVDTVRGNQNTLRTSSDGANHVYGADGITSFNSDGYSLGADSGAGVFNYSSSQNYTSWTFRKQKGFFDIVTFQQSGADSQTTPQVVPHNLGVAPGMILLKKTNGDRDWFVYHRDLGKDYWIKFDQNGVAVNENNSWGTTTPDANNFGYMSGYIGGGGGSAQFVAYLFGGGESTAATARSVDFDGAGDQLNFAGSSSGIAVGTGNFTCEFWVNLNGATTGNDALLDTRSSGSASDGFQLYLDSSRNLWGYVSGNMFGSTTVKIPIGQWTHIAVVRAASTATKLYVNGTQVGSTYTGSQDFSNGDLHIAADSDLNTETNCKISNFRLTNGQALYTSSFRPPTEPLTTTSQGATSSNVKILACNNSSITGGTVVSSTVQDYGQPTASTDSPFDDPDGFKFGEEGDQNIVKCGSYIGNGSSDGPEINLGWEPQYLLFKNSNGNNENWRIYDSMRGWVTGGDDFTLLPNTNDQEVTNQNFASITSTGFKVVSSDAAINTNGNKIIYMAIRRPDGYVSKPPEAGTEVFNMVVANGGAAPQFVTGFPADYMLYKEPAVTANWHTGSRLRGNDYVFPNATNAASQASWLFGACDYQNGWGETYYGPSAQGWTWKRYSGLDVVSYKGNANAGGVFQSIPHSLGKTPEMIWIKNLTEPREWTVGHMGLDGGNAPWEHYMVLDSITDENGSLAGGVNVMWGNGAPNATHFNIGDFSSVNENNKDFMAILFASVDGISKCGYYDGTGSEFTVTTGFQPRFVLIKATNNSRGWTLMDTLRGWSSGVDNKIYLSDNVAQVNTWNYGEPTANGFKVSADPQYDINYTGWKYIYYAHA